MFKGRKVANPVVQGAGSGAYPKDSDFARAWNNVGKARSELRKIEHRLGEIQSAPVFLNETGNPSVRNYSSLMENPNLNEFPSGAVVDKYGRSTVMRNREHRKISRKDDKYNDEDDDDGIMSGGISNSKRVDFRERQELREINPDGTFTDVPDGQYLNSTYVRPNSPSNTFQTTLTDSRAIRETEIRFLNEPTSQVQHDQRRVGTENKLTHVDVTVPGATKTLSSNKYSTHYPAATNAVQSNGRELNNEMRTAENERLWETASTDSAQSDDAPMKRKLKKSIKDIGEDGLAKIKERIKRQQEKASPRENKENADSYAMGATEMNHNTETHRTLHNDNDPIQPRSHDYQMEGLDKHPKRKVAAGPPPPTYKGFSETEVKYKHTEVKPPKDVKKKEKKKKIKPPKTPESFKEEEEKQDRKAIRVIAKANKKDVNKQKKNEIITTSSWRAGQELVMRELGPLKIRRTSQTSQINENDRGSHLPDGATGGNEETDMQERKTATDMELERARVLSAEARRVLSDLNIGSDEEDRKREDLKRAKSAVKRKAPKPAVGEVDKHSQIKQRHYNTDEIRHYIQTKKAERMKKQVEEEKRQKKADELRRKQLEELYNKQKQTALHSKRFKEIKHNSNVNTTFSRPMALSDLPRHHPFQADRSRQMLTSDTEPIPGEEEMEMSDGSSTLTGDSMDEGIPVTPPKGQNEDKPKTSQTSQWKASLQKEREFLMENNNSKNIGGFTFSLDSVLTKFSQAVSNQQSESESRPLSVNSGYGAASLNPPRPTTDGSDRTREQRLQAIKETAKHLQEKIQSEARKLTGETIEESGSTNQRWAFNRHGKDEDFVSRYDRMTDAGNDYSVFTSNLPGLQRNSTFNDTEENPVEAAAIRIQAAYRGHTVRQSLNTWKLPSGGTVGGHIRRPRQDEDESSITETSTFSEITITEDSENSLSPQRMVGSGLRDRDFHVGALRNQGPTELVIPRPLTSHQQRDKYSWEEPKPDPDNVFNIFARHQRTQDKQRQGFSAVPAEPQKIEEEVRKDHASSQQTAPKVTTRTTQNSFPRTRSPGVGARSNSPGIGLRSESPQGPAHHSLKSRNEDTRQKTSVSFKPLSVDSEQDDTFHESSYSRPFEAVKEDRSNLKSEKASVMSHTKTSQKHSAEFDTDTSSMDDFSRAEEPERRFPPPIHSDDDSTPKASLRYSPDTLERKFYTELNQLESMEESMRQLTGVERTRAVSMAQQETVSLAQMLKAKQQTHEREMKLLEIKVQQEKIEAARIEQQMEEAKQRSKEAAQNAKDVMTRVQGDGKEDLTPTKYTSSNKLDNSDNIRPKRGAKSTQSASDYKGLPDSARTYSGKSSLRTTTPSYTTSRSVTSNVKTASDTQKGGDSDSSIRSVSGAEARDESKSESILEDISQASGDEYSINFDDTMTEDEIEEKSFKAILPSESHRKRAKKHHHDNMSVTSDEGSVPNTPRISVDDLGSYVLGEDSFNKFTEEMVKQFMKEEEMRAQHQASLLQLREKALIEKTKAELDWLEQQKQRIRNKGADDAYPNIVKRQRGLKLKLQEQQAEIKRMREANQAASRERQLLLQQREEISRLRQATKETKAKLSGRLTRPDEVHTEDEFYMNEDGKDTDNETSQKKDYKSDSEIYTEPKAAAGGGEKSLDKLKKLHLDERYLTKREQRLRDRKKTAKELLDWKKRLDEEEKEIFELEKKAMKVWDQGEKGKKKEKEVEKAKTANKKEIKEPQTPSIAQDDTIISENISLAKDESITNTPRVVSASESSPDDRQNKVKLGMSESESSIVEEVRSEYSMDETTPVKSRKSKPPDSATIDSQYSETFEDPTSVQTSRKSSKSPRSPLDRLSKRGLQMGALAGRNISSPRSLFSKTRSCSESESEESISQHTDVSYAETQSDLSDFEGRVRALNEELRQRKQAADRLKRERKKRRREILKSKEVALKKQIEAYDNQISQLKTELQKEMSHEPVKSSVKPQIKQPKVSPTKNLKSPLKQNDERSSNSSYDESAQNSPTTMEDKESKLVPSDQKPAVAPSKIPTKILDKISEGSESSKSQATVEAKKQMVNGEDESIKEETDLIEEEISEAESFTEKSKTSSGLLKIPKSPKSDGKSPRDDSLKSDIKSPRDDYSYQDDFTEDITTTHKITSARSLPHSETVDLKPQPSPRSITENIISEVISEHVGSHIDDESFIKPLKNVLIEYNDDSDEPKSPPSTTKTDSRPSSGKSVSSFYDESESDRPGDVRLRISPDKSAYSEEVTTDESPIQTSRRADTMIPGGLLDIDQLLGPNQDEEDEETPLASPRDEEPQSATEDEKTEDYREFTVGDRVQVTGPDGNRQCGTLMFKGRVKFAPGIWAGVELESPDGRNDGLYEGERYFTCRLNHGVLVPANDMSNAPLPKMRSPLRTSQESLVRSSLDSNLSGNTSADQDELNKLIKEADENVRIFEDQQNQERLADKITDDILIDLVNKERDFISNKTAPPVAPKPQRSKDGVRKNESENILVNGNLNDLEKEIFSQKNSKTLNLTDKLVNSLLDDALTKMITTRNKQRNRGGVVNNLIDFDDFHEETQTKVHISPSEELLGVLNKPDSPIVPADVPQRPGSPLPGSKPKGINQNDLNSLRDDMRDLLGGDDDYFDDELLKPGKAPPPYPGSQEGQIMKAELQKIASEDLYYAVPHEREEVGGIVADCVEAYWQVRRCGEPLDNVKIPENYFSNEDTNGDLDSNSRRVFKKLLFDLTGEVIRDIYKDEEDEPPPWQKPKRRQQKYFRGASPPTTIDNLTPIVQQAVINTLGLNGSRKADKNKWTVRKRKDHVDNILVEELREEEPRWINYDEDELAVKMQLTDTIFDMLLNDTVQTMNRVYQKKKLGSKV